MITRAPTGTEFSRVLMATAEQRSKVWALGLVLVSGGVARFSFSLTYPDMIFSKLPPARARRTPKTRRQLVISRPPRLSSCLIERRSAGSKGGTIRHANYATPRACSRFSAPSRILTIGPNRNPDRVDFTSGNGWVSSLQERPICNLPRALYHDYLIVYLHFTTYVKQSFRIPCSVCAFQTSFKLPWVSIDIPWPSPIHKLWTRSRFGPQLPSD